MNRKLFLFLSVALTVGMARSDVRAQAAERYFFARGELARAAGGLPSVDGKKIPTAAEIAADVKRTHLQITRETYFCPVCKGHRPFLIYEPDEGQFRGRISIAESKGEHRIDCPFCLGKGRRIGYRDDADMMRAFAAGRRSYETACRAKGFEPIGFAFLPSEAAGALTTQQVAAVGSAYGVPCSACGWSGVARCRKCRGEGFISCRHTNCKNGWIIERNATSTAKTKKAPMVRACPECRGTGKVICPECDGARGVPCPKCRGEGLAPLCQSCNGTGLTSGKNGDELCRSCKGLGRKRN